MKRLTKPGITYNFPKLDIAEIRYLEKIQKRLAAYEDSGLEPEEIADFMKRWEQAVEIGGMLKKHGIDHIRDIIQAEQDGLIPPCKRGDVVYCIRNNPRTGCFVKSLTVCTVTIWEPGRFSVFTTKEDELGKTAFLTREEAEAALKGGESDA